MKLAVQITFLIVVLLLICRTAADESASSQDEAIAAFERGKALLEGGELARAIQELQLGTHSVEKEVLARANLARAYMAKGETQQANTIAAEAVFTGGRRIRKAVADGTISAQLYVDRGFAWLVRREVFSEELTKEDSAYDGDRLLQAAIEDLEHAIELDAECFHAYRLMAWLQLTLGNCRESIEMCDKAIVLQPERLDLYFDKVRACLESERGRGVGEVMILGLSKLGELKGRPMSENAADRTEGNVNRWVRGVWD